MPTVCIIGPYRFYFFSHEPNEPPHVHVDRDGLSAKFWLEEISLAKNLGFGEKEINKLQKIVAIHQQQFIGKWHEYFGS
ncbi:MAG: DUF4160 domain-containing protein [Verrucomicrobia bacterium]|nr:DUF4160 domain-containing protein [Verrucomicrobiota bacterium]